jgi:hypothetical protein
MAQDTEMELPNRWPWTGKRTPLLLLTTAAVAVALSAWIAPWYWACNVPVQLRLKAPTSTRLELRWGDGPADSTPLVPTRDGDDPAELWLGDLPPLPNYRIAIVFRTCVRGAAFDGVKVLNTQSLVPIFEREAETWQDWLTPADAALHNEDGQVLVDAPAGGRLLVKEVLTTCTRSRAHRILRLSGFLTLMLLLGGGLLIGLVARPPTPLPVPTSGTRRTRRWLLAAFVPATLLHLMVVGVMPIIMGEGDTDSYLIKAVALAERGTYDTGAVEYELNRLPGYALFLAGIFKVAGYHLSLVPFVQGLMFCGSALALAFALRRWVPAPLLAAGLVLAILSPFQIWSARSIMSESTFSTFANLALACLCEHLNADSRRKALWLLLFGALATEAIFIRPNGITVFAALVPTVLPRMLDLLRSAPTWNARIRESCRMLWPYGLAAAMPALALLAWSARNYQSRHYFGATDMGGVSLNCGLLGSGTFDCRGLVGTPYYDGYQRGRYESDYWYHGWHLRHAIFVHLTDNGIRATEATIPQLDQELRAIARRSWSATPWPLRLAAWARLLAWAVQLPQRATFAREGIRFDYGQFLNGPPEHIQQYTQGLRGYHPAFVADERRPSLLAHLVTVLAGHYFVVLAGFLLMSVLGCAYLAAQGHQALTGFGFVFAANVLLNVLLLNVFSRYLHVFDSLVVFQSVLALGMAAGQMARHGNTSTEEAPSLRCAA